MRTKFLAIFALATVLMACDNQGKNEPAYVPGHEVILNVGMPSSGQSVAPRMVYGTASISGEMEIWQIGWAWSKGDKIDVIVQNDKGTKQNTFDLFDFKSGEVTGWAKFRGIMPSNFDPEKDKFTVECGPRDLNRQQAITKGGQAPKDIMHFISEKSYSYADVIANDEIRLVPVWSTLTLDLGLSINVSGTANLLDANYYISKIQLFKLKKVNETYERDGDAKVVSTLDADVTRITDTKVNEGIRACIPLFVEQENWENGLEVEFTIEGSAMYGEEEEKVPYDCPHTFVKRITTGCNFRGDEKQIYDATRNLIRGVGILAHVNLELNLQEKTN